jgi:TPR repeat protein
MGDLYRKELGVKQDYQKALDWYIEGAESENPISQYGLSVMYREGLGVEKDLVQSADWAKLAREQGYPPDEEGLDL